MDIEKNVNQFCFKGRNCIFRQQSDNHDQKLTYPLAHGCCHRAGCRFFCLRECEAMYRAALKVTPMLISVFQYSSASKRKYDPQPFQTSEVHGFFPCIEFACVIVAPFMSTTVRTRCPLVNLSRILHMGSCSPRYYTLPTSTTSTNTKNPILAVSKEDQLSSSEIIISFSVNHC